MAPKLTVNNFWIERIDKDEKYITVYDQYRPNFQKTAVTPKFYSKYESGLDEDIDPVLFNYLIRATQHGPKQKMDWPETTNQEYGWFQELVYPMDRNDPRFYFPRGSSEITRFGLQALQQKKK